MIDIEKIAHNTRRGLLSAEKASHFLWEAVFRNHNRFGLGNLSEDSLQEFLLFFQQRFARIIFEYRLETGTFTAFLNLKLQGSLKSWKRSKIKELAALESCRPNQIIDYDLRCSDWEQEQFLVCEDTAEPERIRHMTKTLSIAPLRKDVPHRLDPFKRLRRINAVRKETILILALKSCYDLTDPMIEKIAAATAESPAYIYDIVEQAKESLEKKYRRRLVFTKARDNAFYFRRRYEIEKLWLNDSNTLKRIELKYQKKSKLWENANRQLSSSLCALRASNLTISRILGINVRHVEYVMHHLGKNMDKISTECYSRHYENLFGKFKQKQKAGNAGVVSGTYDCNSWRRRNRI